MGGEGGIRRGRASALRLGASWAETKDGCAAGASGTASRRWENGGNVRKRKGKWKVERFRGSETRGRKFTKKIRNRGTTRLHGMAAGHGRFSVPALILEESRGLGWDEDQERQARAGPRAGQDKDGRTGIA